MPIDTETIKEILKENVFKEVTISKKQAEQILSSIYKCKINIKLSGKFKKVK